MIGIVVVGHGRFAEQLVATTQMIVGDLQQVAAVPFEDNSPLEDYHRAVQSAANAVDSGSGVVLLADLFGGTPSNVAAVVSHDKGYQVVAGTNLPMLVTVVLSRDGLTPDQLVETALVSGHEGIQQVKLDL